MNTIPNRRIKNIERTCVVCGKKFLASLHAIEARKNGGTCCSYTCVAKRKHIEWRQDGKFNPNFKGFLRLSNYENKIQFRLNNPLKAKAHDEFQAAIRAGILTRQCCSVCGEPNAEGHHTDYTKPLEVIWLCDKHHKEQH